MNDLFRFASTGIDLMILIPLGTLTTNKRVFSSQEKSFFFFFFRMPERQVPFILQVNNVMNHKPMDNGT